MLIPKITWSADYFTTIVAILGTTISPYLFFWQASQEAEDQRVDASKQPLIEKHYGAQTRIHPHPRRHHRRHGVLQPDRARDHHHRRRDAACRRQDRYRELGAGRRSVAPDRRRRWRKWIFALGIVGTGLLAIPVLAGATAYAVGEGRQWPVGLARKPKEAAAFYAVLALSGAIGIALNFTPINPISALYWSAVINGVLAVPVMVLLMLMARRKDVMGRFVIGGPLYWLGWLSTAGDAVRASRAMGVRVFLLNALNPSGTRSTPSSPSSAPSSPSTSP